jgi:AcrR family transcriptional regulator
MTDQAIIAGRRARSRKGEGRRLREEILDAAEALLLRTGTAESVSIRAVADAVGVTPPSIYRHFPDKDTLLFHVVDGVFGRLDASLEAAAAGAQDPIDELIRKGRAYIAYGLAHPEHYRLLFMCKNERKKELELDGPAIAGSTAFEHLNETVLRVLAAARSDVELPDPYALTCAVWSGVHGITSLRISMPNFPWPSIDVQMELLCGPWREALCPDLAPARQPSTRARR